MLGHLSADERAACLPAALGDAGDEPLHLVGIEVADRDVVEEPERLGPLARDVVHAHGDEIDADRVEATCRRRDHRLRADAIRGRDEHGLRVLVAVEREQRTEPADAADHLWPRGRRDVGLDPPDSFLAGVDVDTGVAVAERTHQPRVDAGAGSSSTVFDSVTGTGTG